MPFRSVPFRHVPFFFACLPACLPAAGTDAADIQPAEKHSELVLPVGSWGGDGAVGCHSQR